jgi:hypothetical protein
MTKGVHTSQIRVSPSLYNERLFGKGIYGQHHMRRFKWLKNTLTALCRPRLSISILELGCYDGKTLEWIPVHVDRYVGIDAGWNSGIIDGKPCGLEAARVSFRNNTNYAFLQSNTPDGIATLSDTFDVGICMETFEHIDPAQLESYVAAYAKKVHDVLLVTVPNEKGLPLLGKAVGSWLLRKERASSYSMMELVAGVFGRMNRVPRSQHKGFDYAHLASLLKKYFPHVRIQGVSPGGLPPSLSFTVGIIASRRPLS